MPASKPSILILGGTAEAATLAARLVDQGYKVTTSLAGRTREPAPLNGQTRTGGFGGAAGLSAYLQANAMSLLVDMTHPFATTISQNAKRAAEQSNVPLIAWSRPRWEKVEGDDWHEVTSIADAIIAIPANARVLLALGSQHIAPFAARQDVHFLVRMIDPPSSPLTLPKHTLLLSKPGLLEEEFVTLRDHKITHIVCRNSGGKASYTKIAAARLTGLPVILIAPSPEAPQSKSAAHSIDAVLDKISAHFQ